MPAIVITSNSHINFDPLGLKDNNIDPEEKYRHKDDMLKHYKCHLLYLKCTNPELYNSIITGKVKYIIPNLYYYRDKQ
jgi:hypothetical protein